MSGLSTQRPRTCGAATIHAMPGSEHLKQQSLLGQLDELGWARCVVGPDALIDELGRLGDCLGARTTGRAGALEEVIEPLSAADAHPRSLSAMFGLGTLPFHVELSHRPQPCRYLLLGCLEPGSTRSQTRLLDWRSLGFSESELCLLQDAPVLLRSGRRSFYSSLMAADRSFLRFDPGCVEPVDQRGRSAFDLVNRRISEVAPLVHDWLKGGILIIDNWRMLHGRGPSERGSGRRLARILINA